MACFLPALSSRSAVYCLRSTVCRVVTCSRNAQTSLRPRTTPSMIVAFGPHRWEIGSEFEEEYEYEYLIDVPTNLHDITMLDIDLRRIDLSTLKGKVVFVINVASKDSKTDKFYRFLVDLYERYHSSGLEIAAFPCNAFDQREPWANDEIKKFAKDKYGAKFLIMHKSFLDHNPVFCLGHKSFPGEILWNFHGMFVFDREGNPAERIPADAPEELIELKVQEVLGRPTKASQPFQSSASAASEIGATSEDDNLLDSVTMEEENREDVGDEEGGGADVQ